MWPLTCSGSQVDRRAGLAGAQGSRSTLQKQRYAGHMTPSTSFCEGCPAVHSRAVYLASKVTFKTEIQSAKKKHTKMRQTKSSKIRLGTWKIPLFPFFGPKVEMFHRQSELRWEILHWHLPRFPAEARHMLCGLACMLHEGARPGPKCSGLHRLPVSKRTYMWVLRNSIATHRESWKWNSPQQHV